MPWINLVYPYKIHIMLFIILSKRLHVGMMYIIHWNSYIFFQFIPLVSKWEVISLL